MAATKSGSVRSKSSKLVVAAIDFGTTFSGYAFALRHDFEANPPIISTNSSWVAGGQLSTLKTPTVLLLDPKQNFEAFGFEAEDLYAELAADNEHEGHFYFRRFKMKLYNSTVSIRISIDFGSAFSGFAFAVRDDLKTVSDNPKISTGTGFVSGQLISHKTPTVLLLNPDTSFAAFGYAAEEKYSNLFEDDRERKSSSHRSYYYFRRLKMRLYSSDRPMTLSKDVEIQDEHGKRMKAIDVFSICIKYLADEFMKLGRNRIPDLTEDDVHWVLTVPAIWSDSSKQFMRVAAEQAGLDGNRLTIALEPEAASLFCMRVPIKSQAEASTTVSQFQEGTKYMVVDAGGGTVDVIVHEIVGDKKLKELTSASGGPWGGTMVDNEFDAFMETIFGKDFYNRFKNECVGDYTDLHRELELKKRNVNSNDDGKETFSLRFALLELMDKKMATLVDQRLQIYNGDVSLRSGKLRIASKIMRGWFKESCLKTTQHLKSILQQKVCAGTKTILLVGGYAESPMLQSEIKDAFRDKTVIIPDEAGLAVLKGAVLFGNDPLVVVSRIARCSYGISRF